MKLLDKKTGIDLVKLVIFVVVTTLATGVLVVLIGNLTFQSSHTYKAVFSDVAGLSKGDDVRIAGVKVGDVKSIAITDRTRALVTFDVADSATVTKSSDAIIKYRNLVGQRYISLTEGVGNTSELAPESTIPISRTQPALDLTVLFNGFKPLFAALTPDDINKLSYEIVQVFQGEGGNLDGLLANTASITNTLANRDQVINELIGNLNTVLGTVAKRNTELSGLIVEFKNFMAGLEADRQPILNSLTSISNLTSQTANLLTGIRPSFKSDVTGLRHVAGNLKAGRQAIDRALQILPIKLNKIGRTAIYGSFFNFYLCQFQGRIGVPGIKKPLVVQYNVGGGRCNLS